MLLKKTKKELIKKIEELEKLIFELQNKKEIKVIDNTLQPLNKPIDD